MKPLLHVVLDRPKIAGNIGAIARVCAGTGAALHVCGPLVFETKQVAQIHRPGLDYWPFAQVHFHHDVHRCLALLPGDPWLIEVGGEQGPHDALLERGGIVVFGPEDGSVSDSLMSTYQDRILTLPKLDFVRSFNLAQCVSAVIFEGTRQQGGVVDPRQW